MANDTGRFIKQGQIIRVYLSREQHRKVEEAATEEARSKVDWVRRAIELALLAKKADAEGYELTMSDRQGRVQKWIARV